MVAEIPSKMSNPSQRRTIARSGTLPAGANGAGVRNHRDLLRMPHQVIILSKEAKSRAELLELLAREGFTVASFRGMKDLLKSAPPESLCCVLLENNPNRGASALDAHIHLRKNGWCVPAIHLSDTWNTRSVVEAMHHGAENFLLKPFEPTGLIDAVHLALRRSYHILSKAKACAMLASLNQKERRIVEMAASGLLNKEIADQLELALVTVKVYRASAMRKLGAGDAATVGRIVALSEIDQSVWFNGHHGSRPNDMPPQAKRK